MMRELEVISTSGCPEIEREVYYSDIVLTKSKHKNSLSTCFSIMSDYTWFHMPFSNLCT